jgi:hypothetical protein
MAAAMGAQLTAFVLTSDLNGNMQVKPFSWTFGVSETICGHAVFYGNWDASMVSEVVVNAGTVSSDGVLKVTVFNPDYKQLSWVENVRLEDIALIYRHSGTYEWFEAVDAADNQVAFYDDVSLA